MSGAHTTPITHGAAEEALPLVDQKNALGHPTMEAARARRTLRAYISQNRETVPVSREDAAALLRNFIVQNEDDVAVFDRLTQALKVKS